MSDTSPLAKITITFNDGTVQAYAMGEFDSDGTQVVSRLKHILESPTLMLEVGDRLIMLPIHNIRSVEVTPPPAKLPDTVLKNLTPV